MLGLSFKRHQASNAGYSKREVSAANFVPYHHHYDERTIITKKKELLQVIKLEGFSFETADDEEIDMKKMVRNSLFKSMADGSLALWFHIVRRRKSVYPSGEFKHGFADYVNRKWKEKHRKQLER